MNVGELCNREVVIVERGDTIVAAAKLMRRYHVGDLVVVEKRLGGASPIGILTDRDIVIELIAGEVDLDSVTVGDVMSPDLVKVRVDEGISETVKLMRSKGIRRLPVVNGQGGLEGIVAVDDLIDLLAEQLKDIVSLIGTERKQEQKKCV